MRYQPEAPPRGATPDQLAEYLLRELSRIAAAIDNLQATAINYGREVANSTTTSATTFTLNWKAGQKQRLTLANSATASLSFAPPEGVCNLMLRIVQDGTGSRKVLMPSTVKWQGGTVPTWSISASAVDVMAMYYDGSAFHATASLDSK